MRTSSNSVALQLREYVEGMQAIGEVVHVLDKVLELRDRIDAVRQARHFPAT